MPELRVLAADVKHLTDARYFAAWNAGYIHLSVGPESLSPVEAAAIVAWLEGPGILLDAPVYESLAPGHIDPAGLIVRDISQAVVPTGSDRLQFLVCSGDVVSAEFPLAAAGIGGLILDLHARPWDQWIADPAFTTGLEQLCSHYSVWIDADLAPEDLADMADRYRPAGIVLRGGDEEKPGVKSFDELDALMDQLETLAL